MRLIYLEGEFEFKPASSTKGAFNCNAEVDALAGSSPLPVSNGVFVFTDIAPLVDCECFISFDCRFSIEMACRESLHSGIFVVLCRVLYRLLIFENR